MVPSGDIHGISESVHSRMVIQFKLDILEGKYINSGDIYKINERLSILERVSTKWSATTHKKIAKIFYLRENLEKRFDSIEDRIIVQSLLYQLISICLTELPERLDPLQKAGLMKNIKIHNIFEKLFIYVHANYDRNITIEDISAVINYSPNYFFIK